MPTVLAFPVSGQMRNLYAGGNWPCIQSAALMRSCTRDPRTCHRAPWSAGSGGAEWCHRKGSHAPGVPILGFTLNPTASRRINIPSAPWLYSNDNFLPLRHARPRQLRAPELGLICFFVCARIPNLIATNITAYLTGNALMLDTTAALPLVRGNSARLFYAVR